MPAKKTVAAKPVATTWTSEELMAVRNLGPGIIGEEKYKAVQAYVSGTNGGMFGPALLGSAAHNQAGPVKIVDGKPVFAHEIDALEAVGA